MTRDTSRYIPADVAEQAPGVARELASAADEVNATIRDVEDVFCNWKLGVTAAVDLGLPDSSEPQRLRFRKQKNMWLLVLETTSPGGKPPAPLPLTTASRRVRLHALTRIPDLSRALLDEARTQIVAMHSACANLQNFLVSLRHP